MLDLLRLDVLQEGGQELVFALVGLIFDARFDRFEDLLLVDLLLVVLVNQQLFRLLQILVFHGVHLVYFSESFDHLLCILLIFLQAFLAEVTLRDVDFCFVEFQILVAALVEVVACKFQVF